MTERADANTDTNTGRGTEAATAAPARVRTVSWDDPSPVMAAAGRLSGLDLLRGILKGDLPPAPIARTMGYDMLEVDKGRSVFGCEPGEHLSNPIGVIHGGVAATLLDTATACAVHSELPAATGYTTLSLTVDYLHGMTAETGPVRCTGRVTRMGGRIAIADGELVGEDGTVHARGSSTCLIFRPEAGRNKGAPSAAAKAPAADVKRTRTFSWPDPKGLAEARFKTTGADFFQRMAEGDLPQVPIYGVLGFRVKGAADGRSVFECTPGEHQYNPIGSVHGGLPATLIDCATGVAIQSQLARGLSIVTIRLNVDYLRAITVGTGPIRCEGEVVRKGAQIAIADGRIVDAGGTLYARGSATYMISKIGS